MINAMNEWMMQIKQQMVLEERQRKIIQNSLTTLVGWFCVGLGQCLYLIPLHAEEVNEGARINFIMLFFVLLGISTLTEGMIFITEEQKKVNVFTKFRYIPVDLKMMLYAKLAIMWKLAIKIGIVTQILASIIRFLAHYSFLTYTAYLPLIEMFSVGIIMSLSMAACYVSGKDK